MFSCASINKEDIESDKSLIINHLIDSTLNGAPHYSLCGNFSDVSDSLMEVFLKELPDSIVEKEDVNFLLKQYKESFNNTLIQFIDTSKFRIVEKLDLYSSYDFYKYHYIASIPLFNRNNNICLLYLTMMADKKGTSDIFLVFEKDKSGNWVNTVSFINAVEIPFTEYHYHDYSLVKKRMFNPPTD